MTISQKAQAIAARVSASPISIITIIEQIIQSLLSNTGGLCPAPTPATVAAAVQNPTPLHRFAVRRTVRHFIKHPTLAASVEHAILEEGSLTTQADAYAMYQEANGVVVAK